jgi:hypothetical protein
LQLLGESVGYITFLLLLFNQLKGYATLLFAKQSVEEELITNGRSDLEFADYPVSARG